MTGGVGVVVDETAGGEGDVHVDEAEEPGGGVAGVTLDEEVDDAVVTGAHGDGGAAGGHAVHVGGEAEGGTGVGGADDDGGRGEENTATRKGVGSATGHERFVSLLRVGMRSRPRERTKGVL